MPYFDGSEDIGIKMPLFRSISAHPLTAPAATPLIMYFWQEM